MMRRFAAILLALFVGCPDAAPQTFKLRPRLFQVGPNPSAIAAQDLNDDGWPEIVTVDRGILNDPREERPANDELSLLLAEGDLNYVKLHPSLKTGFGPYAIAIANIDALKWPDLIVASFHDARNRDINLFLNLKQEGIFKPYTFSVPDETLSHHRFEDGDGFPLYLKPGLTSLTVRDFDGDALRDLIATGWYSDVLVYFPGHREFYFDAPKFFPAQGGPIDIQTGDFDKNGSADLAVLMHASGEVALWSGAGAGQFEERTRFPTRGRLPNKLRLADINADGITDIVVSHRYSDDNVVVFYGDGGFEFSVAQEIRLGKDRNVLEHEIRDLVVEPLNGDDLPDIAAACFASGKVVVLLNEGGPDRKLRNFRQETYSFPDGRPRALCAADLDRNGSKDLAVALWDANAVGLLINQR